MIKFSFCAQLMTCLRQESRRYAVAICTYPPSKDKLIGNEKLIVARTYLQQRYD